MSLTIIYISDTDHGTADFRSRYYFDVGTGDDTTGTGFNIPEFEYIREPETFEGLPLYDEEIEYHHHTKKFFKPNYQSSPKKTLLIHRKILNSRSGRRGLMRLRKDTKHKL